ncbi:hypothetical protein KZZ52_25215 [Dactylosporangium sp. AC04546]|nr:hypothetical protein [Dactylosporangium sp. AC04546]WVK88571.1 hypothetical protein KZZ52_25215 [Dactylosporangium sp. AC04546]
MTSVVPADTAGILGAVLVDLRAVGALDADWVSADAPQDCLA